jgi:hypothetical protein
MMSCTSKLIGRVLGYLGIVCLMLAATPGGRLLGQDKEKPMRVFEMRTYITEPGRLEALHKRFREHTNRLFVKHGMTLIGYWTPAEGPEAENTLVYILAFPSREARDASFKAFGEDPEWKTVRAASEKDGKIVKQVISQFLTPTDYSPIK